MPHAHDTQIVRAGPANRTWAAGESYVGSGISRTRPSGIGGWLGLLCRVLVLWQPLSLGVIASSALNSLSIRGLPLALVIIARLVVAAFGVAAGLALWRQRPGAVGLARASLLLSAGTDVFVYATPYFPNNRPPGDSALILAASLVVRHLADVSLALEARATDILSRAVRALDRRYHGGHGHKRRTLIFSFFLLILRMSVQTLFFRFCLCPPWCCL